MSEPTTKEEQVVGRSRPRALTSAALFHVIRDALTELLGAAATATLLRRASKRASTRIPDLASLTIARDRFGYRYTVPPSWESDESMASLCELMRELRPLLIDLTGPVVVRRLRAIPELEVCGDLLSDGDA